VEVTTPDAALVASWKEVRPKLVELLPRGEHEHLDALVLDLIAPARQSLFTPSDELERVERADRLAIGVETAAALAKQGVTDLEVLAAVVALPWYDSDLAGNEYALEGVSRPLTWPLAVLLAMARPYPRTTTGNPEWPRTVFVHQLLKLPPVLRTAAVVARDFAYARQQRSPYSRVARARPFDRTELSALAPDIPPEWHGNRPPGPPLAPPPPPFGGPREAIDLVRSRPQERFGAYHAWVPSLGMNLPGYLAESRGLVYLVRWDVPPQEIQPMGPRFSYPGDRQDRSPYDEPGWLVDRVTREVETVDLRWIRVSRRWAYPLPPGWQPDRRPAIVDGLAADLATLLPPPICAALEPVIREATARYSTLLSTGTWPDFVVAWRVARHTVWLLASTGCTDTDLLTAALLAARGTARTDTLVDDNSAWWETPPAAQARIARPHDTETDGAEATERARCLFDAPAPLRALVVANAWARKNAETELFGSTPQARTRELSALSTLVRDLPEFHQFR
jgi:hypothetical protein